MRRRRNPLWPLLLVLALVAAACSDPADETATTTSRPDSSGGPSTTAPDDEPVPEVEDRIRIEVLSSQPDRVTGDEARIRITPVAGGDPAALIVELDGRDVTAAFSPTEGEHAGSIEGVLDGLVEGTSSLTARAGEDASTLRLRAWPRQGPMIAGPQPAIATCATDELGLGPGAEGSCAAPARVTWRTIDVDGTVTDHPDPTADPPAGTATAIVDDVEVPAVVRVEHGVIDRSTYELAVLDGAPGRPDAEIEPAWNGRLVVRFGDGCGAGRVQGLPGPTAIEPALLLQGYAVVTASFLTGAVQCNDVIASEVVMMLHERVVELLGEVDLTIGDGTGFGGAIAHLMVQNYPTLLDGVVTVDAHPDTTSSANRIADCLLLRNFYRSEAGAALDEAARTAIEGRASTATCARVERELGTLFDAAEGCDPTVPADARYHAATNPDGLRCTFQDLNEVAFGIDETTGAVHRPLDNVGVQYGLDALDRGSITVDEFLDLNERIGGLDADGQIRASRSSISAAALFGFYENGRVNMGVGDLRNVPIVDIVHDGGDAPGDLNQALGMRLRLTRGAPAESAPGHQIWLVPPAAEDPADRARAVEAVAIVDRWLTAMHDGGGVSVLASARPDEAVSRCGGEDAQQGTDVFDLASGACIPDDRPAGDARTVAGAPLTGDVIKCELRPVDELDYEVSFTPTQFDRLTEIFAEGVCDWTVAGSGQTLPAMPDRSFEDVETPADLA